MQFYTSIGLHVFRNVIRSITGCSTMEKRKRERTRERDNLTFKFEKNVFFEIWSQIINIPTFALLLLLLIVNNKT